MSQAQEKQAAALRAVAYVQSGMTLGLGTGSTAYFATEAIGELWRAGTLTDIRAIPTSEATARQAASYDIPLVELEDVTTIDLTIDGADEFDPQARLIKGGGGALFREKLVAFCSKQMIVVSDASKRVDVLGAFPLPVEVLPKAHNLVLRELQAMSLTPVQRMHPDGLPYLTDNGNFIIDCHIGRIPDPQALDAALHAIPGLLETGLFIGLATRVIMGTPDGVIVFEGAGKK